MGIVVSVPTEQLAADLQPLPADVEVVFWPMTGPAPRAAFDLIVVPYLSGGGVLARLRGVRVGLVQGQSIGYEGIERRLPPGVRFANASSVHETSTAELAVALVLAAQRGLPGFVRAQDAGRWEPTFTASLADRRVLLLGFGGIGTAIAARLAPFEVSITAVASRPREERGIRVATLSDLPELLPRTDIMIASLPGGEATKHLVDDPFLCALPDGALVVNVGRGTLIDTDALVRHAGRIRAALDVTDPEPLPADHPLWRAPGILIAPHVGGATSAMRPRIADLVRRQIAHLRAGEDPENVVLRT